MKSAPRKTIKTKPHHGPTPMKLSQWLLFWSLVLCVMVVINASFAKYQKPSQDLVLETEVAGAIAESLERQADMLEEQADALQDMKPTGRLFITVDKAHGLCGVETSLLDLPANQTILFEDKKTGVTASLPYNFAWGNDGYGAFPYEVNGFETNSFLFGKVGTYTEGCWGRDAALSIFAPTSTGSLLRVLRAGPFLGFEVNGQIQQSNVNGLTVYSYSASSTGSGFAYNIWDAVGRTYWYRVTSSGVLTNAEAVKIIQSLRVTQ